MKRTIIKCGWCWRTMLVGLQHGRGGRPEGSGYWWNLHPIPFLYIEVWRVAPDQEGA